MAEAGERRMVVCRVGGERCAMPVASVREVVALPPVARIPGAPEAVRGVANVHGTLVTTVSARRLLGMPALQCDWLIVLSLFEGRVGIEVDEVEDVEEEGPEIFRILDLDALIRPLLSKTTW